MEEKTSPTKCPKRLAVIGGGFVGLHAAVHAARKGVREVIIVDIDPKVVATINTGSPSKLHVKEKYITENWETVKTRIKATQDYREAIGVDTFIVAVQTPLKGREIDYTPLKRVAEELSKIVRKGALIVSEVTTYPGGTRKLLAEPIATRTGLELDRDLYIAHAPERLNAGSTEWTPETIPRVIGGIGPQSLKKAVELYRDCLEVEVHPVEDIRIAEASKLLENSYRFLNIAFINELKRALDKESIDIRQVINAASTKPFGYTPFYPGPYIGGACLPKDSKMLEDYTGSLLLRIARHINETQPLYYAALILKKIREKKARKILFYGLGFKPNSPYPAHSPPLKVAEELKTLDPSLQIKYYDPQILEKSSFKNEEEATEWADIIIKWGYREKRNTETSKVIRLEEV